MTRRSGYAVHNILSPQGQKLLTKHKLTVADIDSATQKFKDTEATELESIVGLSRDGLIAYERNTRCTQAVEGPILIPWIQLYELLERVAPKSTALFLKNKRAFLH